MLIGKKVILEDIHPDSVEQMRVWRNDPNLRQYFREYKYISVDKQKEWYASRGNNSDPRHVYFQIMEMPHVSNSTNKHSWAVIKRRLIGCCGLHYIDWRIRTAEFGIFLGDGRGGGKGKEALAMMCDYGFRELNLHRIWCEVYDGNASINLYRKLGFRDEGVLRDSYFCNGSYVNSLILGVLEDEWFDLHPREDGPMWKMET
jgi:RimJ/RimL family protein N-acetyltransferase